MIKIDEENRRVKFGVVELDYDDPDFFEEFILYYDYEAVFKVEDIEEVYEINKSGNVFVKKSYIKTLFINNIPVVSYLDDKTIEFVVREICEQLYIDDEIEVV